MKLELVGGIAYLTFMVLAYYVVGIAAASSDIKANDPMSDLHT